MPKLPWCTLILPICDAYISNLTAEMHEKPRAVPVDVALSHYPGHCFECLCCCHSVLLHVRVSETKLCFLFKMRCSERQVSADPGTTPWFQGQVPLKASNTGTHLLSQHVSPQFRSRGSIVVMLFIVCPNRPLVIQRWAARHCNPKTLFLCSSLWLTFKGWHDGGMADSWSSHIPHLLMVTLKLHSGQRQRACILPFWWKRKLLCCVKSLQSTS